MFFYLVLFVFSVQVKGATPSLQNCNRVFLDTSLSHKVQNKASVKKNGTGLRGNTAPAELNKASVKQNRRTPIKLNGKTIISQVSQAPVGKLQNLTSHVPAVTINGSNFKKLNESWKKLIVSSLPDFQMPQLWTLWDKLASMNKTLDLAYERDFFKILAKTSQHFIPSFDKDQLIKIIWTLKELNVQAPPESFILVWRETAWKKQRDFSSLERYALHDFFRQLNIPSSVQK